MRILLVSNYQPPHPGGIEYAAESLKECWTERGHAVTWLTTDIPRGAIPPLTEGNIRVPSWNGFEERFQINSPLVSPFSFPLIRRLIREHDVINPHSLAPGLASLALVMALRQRKPVVATQHVGVIPLGSALLNRVQQRFLGGLARWATNRDARLTFVGEGVRQWFEDYAGLDRERLSMTPAGINPRLFHFVTDPERARLRAKWNLPADRFSVLFIGRFVEKKGLPLIRELAAGSRDILFTLVGSGVIRPEEWNLPNVRILSQVSSSDLRELYGAHDLFLMPSFGEGWPAVVPQAMACGLFCMVSEETFDGYRKDKDRFCVVPRTLDKLSESLGAYAGRQIPMPPRQETSDYATAQWNWMRTAILYEDLFVEAMAGAAQADLPGGALRRRG